MLEVKKLITKKDALRTIRFLLSKDAFHHIWAPGEKDMVRQAVLKSIKEKGHHQYWFIEDNKKIIGAIGVNENSYKSGGYHMVEDYVAVHKDYRRKGLGSLLLKTMEEFVKKNKGRYLLIETCDIDYYQPARLFYEKNGYIKVGAIPDYYNRGEGRIDYWKKI